MRSGFPFTTLGGGEFSNGTLGIFTPALTGHLQSLGFEGQPALHYRQEAGIWSRASDPKPEN
jgi:hypothetical protein